MRLICALKGVSAAVLSAGKREKTVRGDKSNTADFYPAANEQGACIIASDPDRYPAGSLLAIRAELVLNPERTKPETGMAA